MKVNIKKPATVTTEIPSDITAAASLPTRKERKKAIAKAKKAAAKAARTAIRKQIASGARAQALKDYNSDYTRIIDFVETIIPGWQDLSEAAVESAGRYTGALRRNTAALTKKQEEYQTKINDLKRLILSSSGQRKQDYLFELSYYGNLLDKTEEALSYFNYGSPSHIRNIPGAAAAIRRAAAKAGIEI